MNRLSGNNVTRVCLTLPPKIQSEGLWKQFSSRSLSDPKSFNYNWLEFSLPRFELTIALIFILTQSLHSILKRFGFPLFTSQLLVSAPFLLLMITFSSFNLYIIVSLFIMILMHTYIQDQDLFPSMESELRKILKASEVQIIKKRILLIIKTYVTPRINL